ncbi:MAG: hypothetical protein ACKVK4_08265, partial [Flavobacteriales bacterium]
HCERDESISFMTTGSASSAVSVFVIDAVCLFAEIGVFLIASLQLCAPVKKYKQKKTCVINL